MADARITSLTALGAAPAANDLLAIVDVDNLTDGATGSTLSITFGFLVGVPTKETPSGLINGSNLTYTLAHTPVANTMLLILNGQVLAETTDYSVSGTTITMVSAIPSNYSGPFIAMYRYST